MAAGKDALEQRCGTSGRTAVLEALAPLVLDDVALVVELLLGQRVEQRGEAVGLEPEQQSRDSPTGTVSK